MGDEGARDQGWERHADREDTVDLEEKVDKNGVHHYDFIQDAQNLGHWGKTRYHVY